MQVSLIKCEQSIDNIKLDISTRQYVPYTAGQDATSMFLSFTIILHNYILATLPITEGLLLCFLEMLESFCISINTNHSHSTYYLRQNMKISLCHMDYRLHQQINALII